MQFATVLATLLLTVLPSTIPGYDLRTAFIENNADNTPNVVRSFLCDVFFAHLVANDLEACQRAVIRYPHQLPDSSFQVFRQQTCFKYAIEHDRVEIAKFMLDHSLVPDSLLNIISYLFEKHKLNLFLLGTLGLVSDVVCLIKSMFAMDCPFVKMLFHSGFMLVHAVSTQNLNLVGTCLEIAPNALNCSGEFYWTCPLHSALVSDPVSIPIIRLLARKTTLFSYMDHETTALGYYLAFVVGSQELTDEHRQVIKVLLIDAKSDPNVMYHLVTHPVAYKCTALGNAIIYRNASLIQFLIELGVPTDGHAYTVTKLFGLIAQDVDPGAPENQYSVRRALESNHLLQKFECYLD